MRRGGPGRGRRLLLPGRAQLDGHQGVEETLGRGRAAQFVAGPRLLQQMLTLFHFSHATRGRHVHEGVRVFSFLSNSINSLFIFQSKETVDSRTKEGSFIDDVTMNKNS